MTLNQNFFALLHAPVMNTDFYSKTSASYDNGGVLDMQGCSTAMNINNSPCFQFTLSTAYNGVKANSNCPLVFVLPCDDDTPITYKTTSHADNIWTYYFNTTSTDTGNVLVQRYVIPYKNSGATICAWVKNNTGEDITIKSLLLMTCAHGKTSNNPSYTYTDTLNDTITANTYYNSFANSSTDKGSACCIMLGKVVLDTPVTLADQESSTFAYNIKGLQAPCRSYADSNTAVTGVTFANDASSD